jgi:hypothetical protein
MISLSESGGYRNSSWEAGYLSFVFAVVLFEFCDVLTFKLELLLRDSFWFLAGITDFWFSFIEYFVLALFGIHFPFSSA